MTQTKLSYWWLELAEREQGSSLSHTNTHSSCNGLHLVLLLLTPSQQTSLSHKLNDLLFVSRVTVVKTSRLWANLQIKMETWHNKVVIQFACWGTQTFLAGFCFVCRFYVSLITLLFIEISQYRGFFPSLSHTYAHNHTLSTYLTCLNTSLHLHKQ